MKAYYELSEFPGLSILEKAWTTIRDEYLALDVPLTPVHRFQKTYREVAEEMRAYLESGGAYGWMTGWGAETVNHDWIQYSLMGFGRVMPAVLETMPRTVALLDELPGVQTAAIAKLKAGGSLACHRHADIQSRGLLLLHLTLDAPTERNYAYLNVAGEFRRHTVGSIHVFDGGLDHFAINESDGDRTIFYLEFEKEPGRLEAQREARIA